MHSVRVIRARKDRNDQPDQIRMHGQIIVTRFTEEQQIARSRLIDGIVLEQRGIDAIGAVEHGAVRWIDPFVIAQPDREIPNPPVAVGPDTFDSWPIETYALGCLVRWREPCPVHGKLYGIAARRLGGSHRSPCPPEPCAHRRPGA